MVLLSVVAVTVARFIERSWIGRGLAALRDNEEAAECMGVPTLRLKLFATTVSGFLLGVAGAPFPYYVTFVEPNSAFHLDYAANALAMPMIGGTTSWVGPVIGRSEERRVGKEWRTWGARGGGSETRAPGSAR